MMNLLRSIFCFRLILAVFTCSAGAAAPQSGWEDRFAQPPTDSRILKIVHNWPDTPEAQDQWITRLTTQGFGGVVCNVSFDQYLESDAKWLAFTRAVNAAKEAGMAMWLYDERGYPSGNAGGLTLRDHPHWEARGLLVATRECESGPLVMDLPPGQLTLAAAFPVRDRRIDLTDRVNLEGRIRDGKLNWEAPPGRWRVMAITEDHLFEGTHAAGNLHAKIPYVNLLMPEPTARFAELTYGGYSRHLGNDLGKYFTATFTDEPSLMSLFLQPMPYSPLPWSPNLPVEFRKRRGYALDASLLPALVAEAGSRGARIRYDFWLTVGELVSENYFGQLQSCCRKLGVPSGGHLLAEEGIVGHVPLYGDFFRCIRRLDAPSIDCLTSLPPEVPWYIARLLGSAADLEGRTLVMSETSDHSQRYRPAGDQRPIRQVSEAEIRGTCNRLIVEGVNSITSYYSYAGLSDNQLRRLNEYIGRCCTALRGGQQVADVAVLYPAESLWVSFTPSRQWTREVASPAARIESVYRTAAEALFNSQRDFTFVDSRALAEASVKQGALVHGKLRWHVVILPGADTLPIRAWRNLARFVRQGGVVIALGALPANSENEFPSARVGGLAQEMFGQSPGGVSLERKVRSCANARGGAGIFLPFGLEALLPSILDGLLEPDLKIAAKHSPIRFTHRRFEHHEVYFVVNDSATPWSGQVEFAAGTGDPSRAPGERWNPATGRMEETLISNTVRLGLEPYGAAFVRFPAARVAERRAFKHGSMPAISLHPLPQTEPTAPHGEFVRAELSRDEAHATNDAPAWRASAVLTKDKVDTHLFTQFHYAQPLDLSQAAFLSVETRVPEGQSAVNQILVILHEQNGGDFIADTGRSLAAPGLERSFVVFDLFKLAGWSRDPDGVLDLKKVNEIRIGWGGYLGNQGERVEFSVASPQVGRVGEKSR